MIQFWFRVPVLKCIFLLITTGHSYHFAMSLLRRLQPIHQHTIAIHKATRLPIIFCIYVSLLLLLFKSSSQYIQKQKKCSTNQPDPTLPSLRPMRCTHGQKTLSRQLAEHCAPFGKVFSPIKKNVLFCFVCLCCLVYHESLSSSVEEKLNGLVVVRQNHKKNYKNKSKI